MRIHRPRDGALLRLVQNQPADAGAGDPPSARHSTAQVETGFPARSAPAWTASHSSLVAEIVYVLPGSLARGFLIPPAPLPSTAGSPPPRGPPAPPRPSPARAPRYARTAPRPGRPEVAAAAHPRRAQRFARRSTGPSPLAARRQLRTTRREIGIRSRFARRRIRSHFSGEL